WCARAADAFGANLLFLGLSPEYLEAAQQVLALVGGAPAGSYRSGAERDRLGHTVVAHQVEDPEDRVGIVFPYRPEQVGGDGGTLAGEEVGNADLLFVVDGRVPGIRRAEAAGVPRSDEGPTATHRLAHL